MADVRSLIKSYPEHKKADRIIEAVEEHGELDEHPLEDAPEAGQGDAGQADDDASSVADDDIMDQAEIPAVADHTEIPAVGGGTSTAVAQRPNMSEEEADMFEKSQNLINTLKGSLEALRQCGAVGSCMLLEREIHKEERRQRNLCRESPAVVEALVRRKDFEQEQANKRKRLVEEANRQSAELRSRARQEAADAAALVKKRKAQVAALENLLESKQTVKRFPPSLLGEGRPKAGGAVARKHRFEVLERLARTGVGLSTAQKNDWVWFKEAWDERMAGEWGEHWGGTFAEWMQEVVNQVEAGTTNAMSQFVWNETTRNFDDMPALVA